MMTLFAQSLFNGGVTGTLLFLVKIIATVGGAVVGWFVSDPLTRVVYRASAAKPTPGSLLLGTKLGGAAALAVLVYVLFPDGSGPGGFGFGPGPGGLPGKGPGDGTDKVANKDAKTDTPSKDAKEKKTDEVPPNAKRQIVEIEILGGDAVQNNRYYKIKGERYSHDELKEYFEKNASKIKIVPVLTEDSVGLDRENNPLVRLKKLADECKIERLADKMPDS